MATPSEVHTLLTQSSILPSILPLSTSLSYTLSLTWPTTSLTTPGTSLDRDATQPEPVVTISPIPSQPLSNLVLICTDPDLLMDNDTYFGQVRHWLLTNLSSKPDGSLDCSEVAKRSEWVGPAPLPNYLYSRPHRYIFILAQPKNQSSSPSQASDQKIEITPADLRALQEPYVAALAGKQGEVQDIKDRWGFNAQALLEKKGLEVLAVNYMLVGGNVKSAGANAGMMVQGAVNKVCFASFSFL